MDSNFFERITNVKMDKMCIILKPRNRTFGELEDIYPDDLVFVYYLSEEKFSYLIFRYKQHIAKRRDPRERIELFECTDQYGLTDWNTFERILKIRNTG